MAPLSSVPLGTLVAGHGQAVNSVTFSSDGKNLAAAADDGLVTLWHLNDRRNAIPLGPPLRAHGDPVTSVQVQPSRPSDNGHCQRRQNSATVGPFQT